MKSDFLINQFEFASKSTIKAGAGLKCGEYPFFTSSDIKTLKLNEYLLDDEAVIIGTGGMPSCNYYFGKFSYSTDNFVLTSKGKVFAKWLYYFIRNNNMMILSEGFHGAGLKHISKKYLSNIQIPLLDAKTQEKQIKILDLIRKNIDLNKTTLIYLDEIVKSRFIGQISL